MRLIDAIKETFVFVEKTRTPDGQGGFFNSYVDGDSFEASITIDAPAPVFIVAEQKDIAGPYLITVDSNIELSVNEIVKRASDGRYFIITSDTKDGKTPKTAGLKKTVVKAERLSRLPM